MRVGLLAILLAGCHVAFPLTGGSPSDGGGSGDADDGPLPFCFGHPGSFVKVCLRELPGDIEQLTGAIDTSAPCDEVDDATTPAADTVCVKVAKELRVLDVQVTGTRPLILLGTDSVTIVGSLAAGGGPRGCPQASNPTATSTVGGGGAGGSRGELGGPGGTIDNASGGTAGAPSPPDQLLGGCIGGKGANAGQPGGGLGGAGGGAVAIVTDGQLTVTVAGQIDASGGGGHEASQGGGGGGGGAGGTIVLDGEVLVIEGAVFANGGGGAEGGIMNVALPSEPGHASPGPTTPGAGGSKTSGNDGGAGAFGGAKALEGRSDSTTAGGGGGGGGIGVIWMFPAQPSSPNISPPPRA